MYWLVACVWQIAEDIAKLPDNLSLVFFYVIETLLAST